MGKKNILVILNGISLRKKYFYKTILPELQQAANIEVKETLSKNDAISLASKAAEQYIDVILAAGGDGTLNQVLNGVLVGRESATKLPVIGLIPLGSGNDFARTVDIQKGPQPIVKLIEKFAPKQIDIGVIQYKTLQGTDAVRYFANMADIGMGPIVVQKVLASGRPFGHAFAYYKNIVSTFFDYKLIEVSAETPEWKWSGKLRTLGVGNGRYYGHGMAITPDAIIDDRLFQVFICGNVSVFDFVRYSGRLKRGQHIDLPEIHYKTATKIFLTSKKQCLIEGDGEMLGQLPATIGLLERQVNFLV